MASQARAAGDEPAEFGKTLRQARERAGLSLQELARRTSVRSDYLRALEETDPRGLPERILARGYLGAAAEELGIDPEPLLTQYDACFPAAHAVPRPARADPEVLFRIVTISLSALIIAALIGWWIYAALQNRPVRTARQASAAAPAAPPSRTVLLSVNSVPSGAAVYLDNSYLGKTPVSDFPIIARSKAVLKFVRSGDEVLQETATLDSNTSLTADLVKLPKTPSAAVKTAPVRSRAEATTAASAATQSAAPPAGTEVSFDFTGSSWIRIRSGQKVLYEGIPAVGTVLRFPGPLHARIGSAGNVRVRVGSGKAKTLGGVGSVVSANFP